MSVETTGKISKRVEKELHQNKVTIRRLPPDFTEEKFLTIINPLPVHSYFYFAPGDSSLGPHGYTRAYITFEDETEIVSFRDQYDGVVLESDQGTKYRIIVEYAPFQTTPRKIKKKADARTGTIEQDSDYKAFLEAYEAQNEGGSNLDLSSYLEELEANKVQGIQPTPLTEYLKEKRALKSRKSRSAEMKRREGSRSKGKYSKDKVDGDSSSKLPKASDEPNYGRGKRKDRGSRDKGVENSDPKSKRAPDPREETVSKTTSVSSTHEVKKSERDTSYSRKKSSESRNHSESGGRSKDAGDSRTRNRDRPDRAIYTPRVIGKKETSSSRDTGDGSEEKRSVNHKDGEDQSQSRSQRYRGRREESEQWQKEKDEKHFVRSRERGRGPRGDRHKEGSDGKQGSKNDSNKSYQQHE